MIKNTPNFLFLTWEDLASGSGLEDVQKFLNLKDVLKKDDNMFKINGQHNNIGENIILDAEEFYERYYYHIKKIKHEQSAAK
jgi:hypothetical protein